MKKILNLLFTVCALSLLTFSYANAQSSEDENEDSRLGENTEDVDCIAINGSQGAKATSGSGGDEGDGDSTDREM